MATPSPAIAPACFDQPEFLLRKIIINSCNGRGLKWRQQRLNTGTEKSNKGGSCETLETCVTAEFCCKYSLQSRAFYFGAV